MYILVVNPSENGSALYRLLEASGIDRKALNVKVFIGFVLKGVKYLEMRNGKLEALSDFDSFLSSCGIEAICIF